MFLICRDLHTKILFGLSGIEAVVVSNEKELKEEYEKAINNKEIAILILEDIFFDSIDINIDTPIITFVEGIKF
ncbi:MAG: hypothetical protein FWF57_06425 [Defluviitaleaceae bacterium]|nr:hypothetical protein [Defluviitaleaceae bacterium]